MFLDLDKHNQDKTAIKDDSGYELSYRDVCDTVRAFEELALPRCVVFCMCESCAGSLVGYLAFENNKQVPLLLSAKLDSGLRTNLDEVYQPSYYWAPERMSDELGGEKIYSAYGYALVKTAHEPYPLNDLQHQWLSSFDSQSYSTLSLFHM
ncbi:MAG: hypothetical protein IJI48_02035 [Ruminococcus sp.]|nr:hypothetical protein [Ruminococcus sp.]